MPASRNQSWRSLAGGIIALVAIAAVGSFVLVHARVGALRGKTFTLYVATADARDIIQGSDVWLAGQRVGRVDGILFGAPEAPKDRRVILRTTLLEGVHDRIRTDSRAELRKGSSIVGAPVVAISSGTTAASVVASGDTIAAAPRTDVEALSETLASAARGLPAAVRDARTVTAAVRTTMRSAGGLLAPSGPLSSSRRRVTALRERLGSDSGSLGRMIASRSDLATRARGTLAAADTIRDLLASRAASLGRFRRDSTLLVALDSLARDLDSLRVLASTPTGTIGRWRTDSAIVIGVDSAKANLVALIADIRAHPLKYLLPRDP